MFKFIDNGLNTKTFSLQLERKSSTNINLNTASILSVKVKQHNISVSSSLRNALKHFFRSDFNSQVFFRKNSFLFLVRASCLGHECTDDILKPKFQTRLFLINTRIYFHYLITYYLKAGYSYFFCKMPTINNMTSSRRYCPS